MKPYIQEENNLIEAVTVKLWLNSTFIDHVPTKEEIRRYVHEAYDLGRTVGYKIATAELKQHEV